MKRRTMILVLVMMILLLVSCGKSSEGTEVPTTTDQTPVQEETNGEDVQEEPVEVETGEPDSEPITIRLAGLKGPTTMGAVKLLEDAKAGLTENSYDFTLATSGDEVVPLITQGEVDIALIPSSLASILYNKTQGKIHVIASNVLGVQAIVAKGEEISSVADLKGKTIMATGKGTVPEMILRIILKANGIDPDADVTMDWRAEPTEIVGVLSQADGIAMLPQPFVPVAMSNVEGLVEAIDLSSEWDNEKPFPIVTGVAVVRSEFLQDNKALVDQFLTEYQASIEFVNSHVEEAAELIESYDIVKAPIAVKAIPKCHLHFMEGEELKSALSGFLGVIHEEEPKTVGGELPKDDFYYEK